MRPGLLVLMPIGLAMIAGTLSAEVGAAGARAEATLVEAADFGDHLASGVTVSPTGRVFVCFPRWSDDVPQSLVELMPDGAARPFPDAAWQAWRPGAAPDSAFVCVQSVYADRSGFLWVLDPASPAFAGVVGGGAKLVQIDLADDRVRRVVRFDAEIAPHDSYLNDVRVSDDLRWAFITDSGLGAIVVVDLGSGRARRVLDGHASVRAEPGQRLTVDGRPLVAQGQTPQINADGIALSPDGAQLYWHALTGATLYRIPTALLTDPDRPAAQLADAIERVAETGPHDGIAFGPDGMLYLTAIESSSILRLDPRTREVATVIRDERLDWPDTLAFDSGGVLYVTASQIDRLPRFNDGVDVRTQPYRLWRIDLPR